MIFNSILSEYEINFSIMNCTSTLQLLERIHLKRLTYYKCNNSFNALTLNFAVPASRLGFGLL